MCGDGEQSCRGLGSVPITHMAAPNQLSPVSRGSEALLASVGHHTHSHEYTHTWRPNTHTQKQNKVFKH